MVQSFVPLPESEINSQTGERALRDMRSLWPVPTLVLAVIVGLLSLAGRGIPPVLLLLLWGALAIFILTFVVYNRRAVSLAQLLLARAREAAASRDRLADLNARLTTLADANALLYEDSRRAASNLRALAQRVSEAVSSTGDLSRVAAPVAEEAASLLGCDGAGVYLIAEDGRTFVSVAVFPPMPDAASALPLNAPSLRESLWSTTVPLTFEDARVLGPIWDLWRGVIIAPLRGHTQGLLGALVLHWNTHHKPDEEALGLVAALAGFAAVALENARLSVAIQADRQTLVEKNARLLDETTRRGQELRALVRRVGDALTAGHSSERVARLVVEQARQMIPCRHVVFSIPEDEDVADPQALIPLAIAGDDPDAWGAVGLRTADFPFLDAVLHRPNPLFLGDVAEDGRLTPRERAALRGSDVAAMLLAPARGRGDRVLGLLALLWSDNSTAPTPEEFETASVLASQAAAALENARLYRDLERTEEELKSQLAGAQAARDFVQRVLQNTPAAVLVLSADADLLIQSANALAEAMPDPERQHDGLAGRRLSDIFPGLAELLQDTFDRAVSCAEPSTLTDLRYNGFERGATYWTFSITPQRDPVTRQVAQIILLALETTDRIRLLRENVENARREQQRANELDATLRSLGDGVVTCDAEGRLASVNRAGQAILNSGLSAPGERVDTWAARIGLCYPSGQPVPSGAVPLTRALRTAQALDPEEYAIHTETGERRLIELTATPVLAPASPALEVAPDSVTVSGAVAVFRDVTELRQSQSQEAAANRRVETLVSISRRLNDTLDLDLDKIHAIITEGARALLPGVPELRALLYDLEAETKTLRLLAMQPEVRPARRPATLQESQPFSVPFDAASPLLWRVYVSRETLTTGDVSHDPSFVSPQDSLHLCGGISSLPAPKSALILPLRAHDTVSGHLALTSSAPDAFADPRLTDALTNLAALAVIARTNAQLYGKMSQRVDELDALWTVGQATASKLELTEVVDTLTDQVRQVMGGEACTLALFEDGTGGIRRLRRQGAAWQAWALNDNAPGECLCDACDQVTQEAALKGEAVTLIGRRNPEFPLCRWRAFSGLSGEHSVLAAPLRFGSETLGSLTVWVRGGRPFAPDQIKLLGTLASLAVAAVRNAQSYAHEQNIAETLQLAFLPGSPTQMPGLDIAEQYHPTRIEEARIGGDYYDFVPLGPRRLAVIIGDISGKGLAAAVYTAMAKYTLRAFAAQEMPPGEVVARANRAIARHTTGEIFSTLFYGVLDLEAGTLAYVNAGHEPPQLARADGSWLNLEPTGLMLGAFADAEWDEETISFAPGDALALFTDGLPDARAADGAFFGEEGIRTVLTHVHSGGAAAIADALYGAAVHFAAEGRLRDDIALLVLKSVSP
jgi:serine phosphatase RsbU (regulator of sigma subunit)/PAS domain-containing protein